MHQKNYIILLCLSVFFLSICFFKLFENYQHSKKEIIEMTEFKESKLMNSLNQQLKDQSFLFHLCIDDVQISGEKKIKAELSFFKSGKIKNVQILETNIRELENLDCIKKQFKKMKLNLSLKKEIKVIYPLILR